MSTKNPIKFLDSYGRNDYDIFFGRDTETSDLYEKVEKSNIVLLYGMSGTGKTSLINCGLENIYQEDQRIFVYVRKGNNILHSLREAITLHSNTLVHPDACIAEAIESLYYDFLKPIIIVFDQFEELFISGEENEAQEFIQLIAEILHLNLKVRFIISLREEYLAHMDQFEETISTIFDHRYRLEKMRQSKLKEVIKNIAGKLNADLENETVPGLIINSISDTKGYVELPYLQVYLDKLTKIMNDSKNGNTFTEHLITEKAGKLEDVLGDFLEEQISEIAPKAINKELLNNLLKQMITSEGTKKRLAFNDLIPSWEKSPEQLKELLKNLETSRILKFENGLYELSHDSLAVKIAQKRTPRELDLIKTKNFLKIASQSKSVLSSKQLRIAKQFYRHPDLSENEKKLIRKSKSRLRIKKAGFSILTLVIIVLLLAFFNKERSRLYDESMQEAEEEMNIANYSSAAILFEKAAEIIFIDFKEGNVDLGNKEAKILADNCLQKESQRIPYEDDKKSGDSIFELGCGQYTRAFQKYYSALNTNYNNNEIRGLIGNRIEDATRKYIDLAKTEYSYGNKGIANEIIQKAETMIAEAEEAMGTSVGGTEMAKELITKYKEEQ